MKSQYYFLLLILLYSFQKVNLQLIIVNEEDFEDNDDQDDESVPDYINAISNETEFNSSEDSEDSEKSDNEIKSVNEYKENDKNNESDDEQNNNTEQVYSEESYTWYKSGQNPVVVTKTTIQKNGEVTTTTTTKTNSGVETRTEMTRATNLTPRNSQRFTPLNIFVHMDNFFTSTFDDLIRNFFSDTSFFTTNVYLDDNDENNREHLVDTNEIKKNQVKKIASGQNTLKTTDGEDLTTNQNSQTNLIDDNYEINFMSTKNKKQPSLLQEEEMKRREMESERRKRIIKKRQLNRMGKIFSRMLKLLFYCLILFAFFLVGKRFLKLLDVIDRNDNKNNYTVTGTKKKEEEEKFKRKEDEKILELKVLQNKIS